MRRVSFDIRNGGYRIPVHRFLQGDRFAAELDCTLEKEWRHDVNAVSHRSSRNFVFSVRKELSDELVFVA